MSVREQKRNKAANDVCRELRYCVSHASRGNGNIMHFLLKWMKVAKKDRYTRPKV
jgi:hypothetical protein